jgi:hypothetical protein
MALHRYFAVNYSGLPVRKEYEIKKGVNNHPPEIPETGIKDLC